MEVKELMIGDLLQSKESKEEYIVDFDDLDYWETISNIDSFYEPIPLTEKVLYSIGLEYYSGDSIQDYWCFPNNHFFRLQYRESDDGKFEVEANICGVSIFIHYVHELQHILHICGLSDVSNNFKIKADEKEID